jgi:hypothetical protein
MPPKSKALFSSFDDFLQIAQLPEINLHAGSLFSCGLFVNSRTYCLLFQVSQDFFTLEVYFLAVNSSNRVLKFFFQVSQEFFTIIGRGRH